MSGPKYNSTPGPADYTLPRKKIRGGRISASILPDETDILARQAAQKPGPGQYDLSQVHLERPLHSCNGLHSLEYSHCLSLACACWSELSCMFKRIMFSTSLNSRGQNRACQKGEDSTSINRNQSLRWRLFQSAIFQALGLMTICVKLFLKILVASGDELLLSCVLYHVYLSTSVCEPFCIERTEELSNATHAGSRTCFNLQNRLERPQKHFQNARDH